MSYTFSKSYPLTKLTDIFSYIDTTFLTIMMSESDYSDFLKYDFYIINC